MRDDSIELQHTNITYNLDNPKPGVYTPLNAKEAALKISALEAERNSKVEEYRRSAEALGTLLSSPQLQQLLESNRSNIATFLKGGSLLGKIWAGVKIFVKTVVKGNFSFFRQNISSLTTLYENISDPMMQRAIVEHGGVLDFLGRNADHFEYILDKAKNPNEPSPLRRLEEKLAPGVLDLLKNEQSREALKQNILTNYMKFPQAGDLTKIEGYRNAYYSRGYIGEFAPDWMAIIEGVLDTVSTQEATEKTLKGILQRDATAIKEDFLQVINQNALVDELNKLNAGIDNPAQAKRVNKELTKLWEEKDLAFSKSIQKLLAERGIDERILREEWYLMGPEIVYALKQGDQDKAVNILIRYGVSEDLFDIDSSAFIKAALKNHFEHYQEQLKEATLDYEFTGADPGQKITIRGLVGSNEEQIEPLMTLWKNGQGIGHTIASSLDYFGIDQGLIAKADSILKKPEDIQRIIHAMRNQYLFQWSEELVDVLRNHPEVIDYIKANPTVASKIAKDITNKVPFLKDLLEGMQCDQEVLDIIAILIKDPDNTKNILHSMNQGDYLTLVKQIVTTAKDDPELVNYLRENKKVFSRLVAGLMQEDQMLYSLLEYYGLEEICRDQEAVNFLVEHFVSNPLALKKALDSYEKGGVTGYMGAVQELLLPLQHAAGKETHLDGIERIARLIGNKIPALRDMSRRYTNADIGHEVRGIVKGDMGILGNLPKIGGRIAEYTAHFLERTGYQIPPAQAGHLQEIIKEGKDNGLTDLAEILTTEIFTRYDDTKKSEIEEKYRDQLAELSPGSSEYNRVKAEKDRELELTIDNRFWKESKEYALKGVLDFTAFSNLDLSSINIPDKFTFIKTNLTDCKFKNSTLTNVSFQEGKLKNVNFNNAHLKGGSFYYANLDNVIFTGAKLEGVNFEGITTSKAIDFNGCTIDRDTLESIANAIHKNPKLKDKFNLNGAKIVGDLSELDLSGIVLSGADLTGVTSMQNTDLRGTSFVNVTCDVNLLKTSVNFESALIGHDEGDKYTDVIRERNDQQTQKKAFVQKVAQTVVAKAVFEDKVREIKQTEKIQEFKEQLMHELENDPDGLSEYFYQMLSENYPKISNTFNLPKAKNYTDLSNQLQLQFVTDLFTAVYSEGKSMNEAYNIAKRNCVANILADTIGQKLFGEEGKNRGEDFQKLRKHFQDILSHPELADKFAEFVNINGEGIPTLKESPEVKILIDSMAKDFYKKSSYTSAGLATGGIYLSDGIFKDALVTEHANLVKEAIGTKKAMYKAADDIGQKIGEQLFGSSMSEARQKETDIIKRHLADEILPKLLEKDPTILDGLTEDKVAELVGEIKYGYTSPSSKSGLSGFYYDNVTSYTNTGMLSGGIQLNEGNLDKKTEEITTEIETGLNNLKEKYRHRDGIVNGRGARGADIAR